MKSSEARHYVQYDQGEDRWLCTLLLQEGYRVEYCAASDALTYAPETFHEFYNQRRRWVPSTIANIIDFLSDYKHIVKVNESISYLYIVYQFFLMISTVLGPATVLLMITGAYNACLGTSLWQSFVLAVGPAFLYLILCYITTTDFQIKVAGLMSASYAIIMMCVLVGTTIQIAEDSWTSPNAIFLMLLVFIFFVAAITHPQEFWCIVPGMLYFLCIPSGYLLLLIYSLCNLNIVSWGTREVEKKKITKKNATKEDLEKVRLEAEKEKKAKKAKKGFFSQFTVNVINPSKYSTALKSFLRDWLGIESNETNNILNLNNDTSVNSNEAKLKVLVEFLIKLSKVNNSLQAKKNVNINFCC
jgi:chitin synthase